MKKIFCLMLLTLSLGCATAVVRPYVGEQQAWPTAAGSVLIPHFALPVFTTLPPAPYSVLAELRLESPFYAQPEPGQMRVLVAKAQELGADAIILVDGNSFFTAAHGTPKAGGARGVVTTANRFNPDSFKPGVSVVAIKWTAGPPEGLEKWGQFAAPKPVAPVEEEKPATPTPNSGPTKPAETP